MESAATPTAPTTVPGLLDTARAHSGTSPHLQPQLLIDLHVSGDAHAPSRCLPWATASCPSGPHSLPWAFNTTADRLFISPCPLRSPPFPSGPCSHRDSGLVPWALSLHGHPLGRTHTQAMVSLVTLLQPLSSHPRGNRPLAENCSNMFSYTDLIGLLSSPRSRAHTSPRLNRTHTQGLDPCLKCSLK